jgi:hypothetical protein
MGSSLMRDSAEGPPPRHVTHTLVTGEGIHAADTRVIVPKAEQGTPVLEARLSVFIVPAGETAAGSANITRQPLPPMTKGCPFETALHQVVDGSDRPRLSHVRRRAQCSQHVLTLRNKVLLVDLDAEFLEASHYEMPKPHLGMVGQVFLRTKPHIARHADRRRLDSSAARCCLVRVNHV